MVRGTLRWFVYGPIVFRQSVRKWFVVLCAGSFLQQLINWSIDESINRPIDQLNNSTLDQLMNWSIDQLINRSSDQLANRSFGQLIRLRPCLRPEPSQICALGIMLESSSAQTWKLVLGRFWRRFLNYFGGSQDLKKCVPVEARIEFWSMFFTSKMAAHRSPKRLRTNHPPRKK